MLFTIKASTPGILLAIPQTTRPTVFPIPIIETKNIQVELSMPNVFALSEKMIFRINVCVCVYIKKKNNYLASI